MSQVTLLLVDNDQDFLLICSEYLENAGYHVIQAHNRAEAQQLLETKNIHLAILDLRLTDDTDEKDRSGLMIAETVARQVPKIILTKFPAYQDVVKALKLDARNLPLAVDFVDKRQGLDVLQQSIEECLNRYAQINWELTIQWNGFLALAQVVNLIEPTMDRALLSERSTEFEDLLRKLFFEYSQITIGDIFAHQVGHVILSAFTQNQHGLKMYLLFCGELEVVTREDKLYETAVPQRVFTEKINRAYTAQTLHFAATAYTLSGGNLEEIVTLNDFIHRHSVAEVLTAVDHLCQQELSAWYEWGRSRQENSSLRQFYLNALGLVTDVKHWHSLLTDLCQKAIAAGIPLQLRLDTQQLALNQNNKLLAYSYPVSFLEEPISDETSLLEWGTIHGGINGDTVLVGPAGETWLVDFRCVKQAPLICDFVSLETAVKFQTLSTNDLHERHQLEQYLLSQTNWQESVASEGLSADVAATLQIITRIRYWAHKLTGCDFNVYNQALYFCTLRFLATYETNKFYTRRDLMPYSHAALAASMLSDIMSAPSQPIQSNFWLDTMNQLAWVEGKAIDLTIQEFQILNYLYEHEGQLCERQAIVENALGEVYDEFDPEQSRLNSAMSRLIQKVEPDSKNRKYFTTVRGRGYKLQIDTSLP